jgi:hypothetical protein
MQSNLERHLKYEEKENKQHIVNFPQKSDTYEK